MGKLRFIVHLVKQPSIQMFIRPWIFLQTHIHIHLFNDLVKTYILEIWELNSEPRLKIDAILMAQNLVCKWELTNLRALKMLSRVHVSTLWIKSPWYQLFVPVLSSCCRGDTCFWILHFTTASSCLFKHSLKIIKCAKTDKLELANSGKSASWDNLK